MNEMCRIPFPLASILYARYYVMTAKQIYIHSIGKIRLKLLHSSPPRQEVKPQSQPSLCTVKGAALLVAFKESPVLLVLVVPEPNRNKNGDELAKDAQKLIQQFNDICPAELPYDLPPLGNIQHQIDFVPGLTLSTYHIMA